MSKDAETVELVCEGEGGYDLKISYVTDSILISLVNRSKEDDNAASIFDFETAEKAANFILNVCKTHAKKTKYHFKARQSDRAVHGKNIR